jgi:hypothetical protein
MNKQITMVCMPIEKIIHISEMFKTENYELSVLEIKNCERPANKDDRFYFSMYVSGEQELGATVHSKDNEETRTQATFIFTGGNIENFENWKLTHEFITYK